MCCLPQVGVVGTVSVDGKLSPMATVNELDVRLMLLSRVSHRLFQSDPLSELLLFD